ncbi:transcription factor MYB98-like [Melia azedarach]|uniref:Transcription factor MYB98-like n=1 Tax=Melia azedarach TaxID=155640 RepID=A0ACC1Z0H4_MELAZ|nr:transcription factor MYB98-like [Melia azedarach]
MEFDSSFRDDYPFLVSLFSDSLFKSDLENGFSFLENSSSKVGLFHNLHTSVDHGLINECFSSPDQLNRFSPEGSSKNPTFGISTPSFDAIEAYTNGVSGSGNGFNSTHLMPNGANGVLHGSESGRFWDYSQKFSAQPASETQIYQPVMNYPQCGSSSTARLPDEISCITGENAYHQDLKADQKRYKRMHVRRERKLPKKNSIIKGQWTPQEDK